MCCLEEGDIRMWMTHIIRKKSSAFVLPGGKVFVFTGILPIVENEGKKEKTGAIYAHRALI